MASKNKTFVNVVDIIEAINDELSGLYSPDASPTGLVDLEGLDQLIENPEAGLDKEDLELMKELEAEAAKAAEPIADFAPTKRKRVKNYVNNADLLIQYKLSRVQDRMTEEFAKMLQTVAQRYALKGSYRNYSYVDDMQSYAMMMVVRTWRSFDPAKSSNPFAFFTQCIKNSFKQYLKTEKKAHDIRDELLLAAGLNPSHSYTDNHSSSDESFGGHSQFDY